MQGFNMGKYYPPDYDGGKHKNLNKYNRERSGERESHKKIVRFALSNDVVCLSCHEQMKTGTRFNAEKTLCEEKYLDAISIYEFKMKCINCKAPFTVKTDPKNTRYLYPSGVKQRVLMVDSLDDVKIDAGDVLGAAVANAPVTHEMIANSNNNDDDAMMRLEREKYEDIEDEEDEDEDEDEDDNPDGVNNNNNMSYGKQLKKTNVDEETLLYLRLQKEKTKREDEFQLQQLQQQQQQQQQHHRKMLGSGDTLIVKDEALTRLHALQTQTDSLFKNDFATNQACRSLMRERRKADQEEKKKKQELISNGFIVPLLPQNDDDANEAKREFSLPQNNNNNNNNNSKTLNTLKVSSSIKKQNKDLLKKAGHLNLNNFVRPKNN